MKPITAKEFEDVVWDNPAWATTLTEPVEITGNLMITAANVNGHCAEFRSCTRLKVARGNYPGSVNPPCHARQRSQSRSVQRTAGTWESCSNHDSPKKQWTKGPRHTK